MEMIKATNAPQDQKPQALEFLTGQVVRITFSNEQTGFTVAQIASDKLKETVTVVGELMAPAEGTILSMHGHWLEHERFGRQFRVVQFTARLPVDKKGIERYLGSGAIRGIREATAKLIVQRFGKKTLEVLDKEIERLAEIGGIGRKRLATIRQSWEEQKENRNVMLFLQGHGIGAATANKIFKHYGQKTVTLLKENPYRLAEEIFGIGFLKADQIAGRIGFDARSPLRLQAGILHTLSQMTAEGHVYYPYEELLNKVCELLKVERDLLYSPMAELVCTRKIVIENLKDSALRLQLTPLAVYLSLFHFCENYVATKLNLLAEASTPRREVNIHKALEWVQNKLQIQLAQRQAQAVAKSLKEKVLIITGGPGTGKTTIVRAITRIHEQLHATILLAAPTGRAAKRLAETTGRPAKTIHRLLEFSPTQNGFQRNEDNPLQVDLLIVDEASMIDILLMHHLLKALPLAATLILVGDVHQLPSVGPGNVLKDLIASDTLPVVTLDQIFRQAKASRIVVNAHRINAGQMPQIKNKSEDSDNDFYFIEQEDPEKILEIILTLTSERIPRRFGFNPIDDIQVLTPMHRGTVGAENLNRELQRTLNPQHVYVKHGEQLFHLNDKVMQLRNNYEKEVFNGDIGRIAGIDPHAKQVMLRFDERLVPYDFTEMEELGVAYAVSVHKSQGSEFPAVVIPVTTQHYVLLQRNLLYTAVTRARKLAVLVGTQRALAIAIKNNAPQQRYTRLDRRLAM
ncbi:MAG: ATP-dependent RecD-like DNA helicase [Desulfobacteraceae bacterium]|nr:ATP-dependent RecD-like DNA helicase [Desulfobacteraceae bacterium]